MELTLNELHLVSDLLDLGAEALESNCYGDPIDAALLRDFSNEELASLTEQYLAYDGHAFNSDGGTSSAVDFAKLCQDAIMQFFCYRLRLEWARRKTAQQLGRRAEDWIETRDYQTGPLLLSEDPRDQIICRLVGSMGSHPAFAKLTSNSILALHGPEWRMWRENLRGELPELPSMSHR